MTWFGAFRGSYGFTRYSDNPTPAKVDIPLAAVTYFCILVSVATLIASLGIRGKDRWSTAIRAIYGLTIGSFILVGAYGYDWQTGSVEITAPYVYRSQEQFRGTIGIRVSLHGVNVTLEGYFGPKSRGGYVFYSEALPWSDYGHESITFEKYVERGLPNPILKVAEYMCADSGGLRWGKTFHTAGRFSCALLWTSFAFWLVTNVLLFSVICYGAYMFVLTGLSMILSCVVFHICQPANYLAITFGDKVLSTNYGWTFWLILVSGITTFVIGLLLVFLDHLFPKKLSDFFAVDAGIEDDKMDINTSTIPRHNERTGSIFFAQERRGSIFQERRSSLYPCNERRPSVFSDPQRRSSLYSTAWYSNKGFVTDDHLKTNPLFHERNSITEETEIKNDIKITIDEDAEEHSSAKDSESPPSSPVVEKNEKNVDSSVAVDIGGFTRQLSRSSNESGFAFSHDSDSASSEAASSHNNTGSRSSTTR